MRDPKVDPQAGDVFRKGELVRLVCHREGNSVCFRNKVSAGGFGVDRFWGIATWRGWTKKAELMEIGGASK
jgi:hypothetical protein